jgi:hypothetical protein
MYWVCKTREPLTQRTLLQAVGVLPKPRIGVLGQSNQFFGIFFVMDKFEKARTSFGDKMLQQSLETIFYNQDLDKMRSYIIWSIFLSCGAENSASRGWLAVSPEDGLLYSNLTLHFPHLKRLKNERRQV